MNAGDSCLIYFWILFEAMGHMMSFDQELEVGRWGRRRQEGNPEVAASKEGENQRDLRGQVEEVVQAEDSELYH